MSFFSFLFSVFGFCFFVQSINIFIVSVLCLLKTIIYAANVRKFLAYFVISV